MNELLTVPKSISATAKERIARDEAAYQAGIDRAREIVLEKKARFIFLAGPSCSGKTTTSQRLIDALEEKGLRVASFSTDDFFFNADRAPRNPDGSPNYDSPEHTDFDLIRHSLSLLEKGGVAQIPVFDFLTSSRTDRTTHLDSANYDVFILEGIHALNDRILSALSHREQSVCLYLNATCAVRAEGSDEALSPQEVRFCRRLIRDFKHRGADAAWTYKLWQNVIPMEKIILEPFIKNADLILKTDFLCEIPMEKSEVLAVLSALPEKNVFYPKAQQLAKKLIPFPALPASLCPARSVLKEFID